MTNKVSQRVSPLYKKLPKRLSLKDFNRYVKPYLSVGRYGPKTKLSTYQIFNYVLYVLHTGIQWNQLKCKVRWNNIYRHHNKWSKDGSYQKLFVASVKQLNDSEILDLSVLHGDGSNAVAKKGVLV